MTTLLLTISEQAKNLLGFGIGFLIHVLAAAVYLYMSYYGNEKIQTLS